MNNAKQTSRLARLGLVLMASLSVAAAFAQPASGNNDDNGNGGGNKATKSKAVNNAYIVQMADRPVSAYTGGISGYPATKPARGRKIDPNDPQVSRYMGYLASRQDAALAGVGGKKIYNYGYVFNGFAAELTPAQAQKLAQLPGVLAVTKDEIRQLTTSSTPTFLGLNAPGGIWTSSKGENVIIGIVDTGAWPEHPSFSDRTGVNGNGTQDGKLSYQQIPGWNG